VATINLTPHAVNVLALDGSFLTFPPSGDVARVEEFVTSTERLILMDEQEHYDDQGMPWWPQIIKVTKRYGPVTGLPKPTPGVTYLVSSIVRDALPDRQDLLTPDTGPNSVIRNDQGQILGVKRVW
jgi:hypothetical protein